MTKLVIKEGEEFTVSYKQLEKHTLPAGNYRCYFTLCPEVDSVNQNNIAVGFQEIEIVK